MSEFTVTGRSTVDKKNTDGYTSQVHIKWSTSEEGDMFNPPGTPFLNLALGAAGGDVLWHGRVKIGTHEKVGVGDKTVAAPTICTAAATLMSQLGDYLDELGKTSRGLALTSLDGIVGIGARL